MSRNKKIILVSIALVLIIIAVYLLFRKKKFQTTVIDQAAVNSTPVTVTNPTQSKPTWTENKFPLDVNMKGDYVLALQRALNRIQPTNPIPVDGVFGPTTKTKLLLTVSTSQSVLPMSSATWQTIITESHNNKA